MKIILIIVFVFLRGSNGVQNVYTKEEYEAFYNWRYQYDKTTFFRAAGQVKSDMETIINDYRAIKEHNGKFKKGNETYYQDLWKKSALDELSRKKITSGFNLIDFNAIFAPKTASRMFQKSRFADLFTVKQANFSAAPNSLDWREYNVVSPVQDQLYECASCWSFSAVAAIESAYALTTGKVVKLSEQQLVDCNFNAVTGNWGCWGGWMAAAFAYLVISNGLTNESDYPYTDTKNPCQFNASLSQVAVGSFVILPTRDEEVLKRTVAAVGPISSAIDASLDSFYNYAGGVYSDPACSHRLTHAIVIIGYGTDPLFGDFWLCRNSWGVSWGIDGNFKIRRNANNTCGIGIHATYPILPNNIT